MNHHQTSLSPINRPPLVPGAAASVCGYIRASTEKQKNTLVAQQQQIEAYCKFKELELVRCFVDPDESGSLTNFYERPQAVAMLAWMAENKRVSAIVITKLDRGFRDALDCLFTVDDLARRNIHLHLLDIQLDTTSPVGKLVLTVMAAIAEFENRRRSERQKAANAVKRQRGERCGTVPYGWTAITVERMSKTGRRGEDLAIHPVEYPLLEKITIGEWGELSCNEVARRLNAAGIRAKQGGLWYGATVGSVRQHALLKAGSNAAAGKSKTEEALPRTSP